MGLLRPSHEEPYIFCCSLIPRHTPRHTPGPQQPNLLLCPLVIDLFAPPPPPVLTRKTCHPPPRTGLIDSKQAGSHDRPPATLPCVVAGPVVIRSSPQLIQ